MTGNVTVNRRIDQHMVELSSAAKQSQFANFANHAVVNTLRKLELWQRHGKILPLSLRSKMFSAQENSVSMISRITMEYVSAARHEISKKPYPINFLTSSKI